MLPRILQPCTHNRQIIPLLLWQRRAQQLLQRLLPLLKVLQLEPVVLEQRSLLAYALAQAVSKQVRRLVTRISKTLALLVSLLLLAALALKFLN